MFRWTRKKTQDELDIMHIHSRWIKWGVYLLIIYIIFSDLLVKTINAPDDVVDYTKNNPVINQTQGELENKVIKSEEHITKIKLPYYSKITDGKGAAAICGDFVQIFYEIVLYDGTIFSNNQISLLIGSGKHNILEQAIDGMKINGVRQVIIQPKYAKKFGVESKIDKNIAIKIKMIGIEKEKHSNHQANCTIATMWKNSIF